MEEGTQPGWDLTAPHKAVGSALRGTFRSRDENSVLGADICFILKVAKESLSWANMVPALDFTVYLPSRLLIAE